MGITAAAINKLERDDIVDLKSALLFRLADRLNVSARWLSLGTGKVEKWFMTTHEEDELLMAIRKLPPAAQGPAMQAIEAILGLQPTPTPPQDKGPPKAPQLKSWKRHLKG